MATVVMSALNDTVVKTITMPDAKLVEWCQVYGIPTGDGEGTPYTNEERCAMLFDTLAQSMSSRLEGHRRHSQAIDTSDAITTS